MSRFGALVLLCSLQLGWGLLNLTEIFSRDPEAVRMPFVMELKKEEFQKCLLRHECPLQTTAQRNTPCTNGMAGEYECSNVDLLAFVPLKDLGSNGVGNDIWGWTDPETDREYVIAGCADGSSFVDITDPTNPQVLGFLPTHTSSSSWRDMKVYANHAFIVSEASNHGMQVFDLTQLRGMTASEDGEVHILQESAHYSGYQNCHNIVGNTDTGFMYGVGATRTPNVCPRGGLHAVDVRDPLKPTYAGCFSTDGYVHDAQCVVYKGPDSNYFGREICFCYNENSLTIVDVEDKSAMKMLSRVPYDNVFYTHQGWLNEEQSHLILNDELDELYGPTPNTRSLIWNVEDLEKPVLIGSFFSEKKATDHNLYVKGNLVYESNYCAGLRVLDISAIKEGTFKELGYFDVAPTCNSPGFQGSWSSYPYYKDDVVAVQSIERGLFVLRYTGTHP